LKAGENIQNQMAEFYPVDNLGFQNWIKLDFNGDSIPDYRSPYQLRKELILKQLDLLNEVDRYKIGRAFYHIAQRRGFKSSRKSGANEKTAVYKGSNETNTVGRNEYENLIYEQGSLGAAFAYLENEGIRVRNRYTLRADYLIETEKIIETQSINSKLKDELINAIFYQRPLRSQKGLVGKCTLEKNKYRCPISHPNFEGLEHGRFLIQLNIKLKEQMKCNLCLWS
jgi:CRISPR-associated endonuclease Csn1